MNNVVARKVNFMQTRVIQVDPRKDLGRTLAPAVSAIRAGGIVGFPTETVYGVGVVATDAHAVARLRELKQRPKGAFTVHIASPADAGRYVRDIPARAATLMSKAWPGPMTILLPSGGRLAAGLGSRALYKRICPDEMVGLRCPSDPVARRLLERAGKPVLATSANLAGRRAPREAEEVLAQLDGRIDVLVDAGPTRHGKASTIVAFDGPAYRIVRAGVYDARTIEQMTRRRILFVCSGNTCRSPMASAIARKLLAERLGCDVEELAGQGQEVLSAGTFGGSSAPATEEAAEAARRIGAEVGKHRSRSLTNELIRSADLVFCMTRRHVDEVVRRVPAAAGRTYLLDAGGDIADPIGGGIDTYVGVAGRIQRSLRTRMKEKVL